MLIERIELNQIKMELTAPFVTSYGIEKFVDHIIICINSEGLTGWGECVAFNAPFYSSETTETAWHILGKFLAPSLVGKNVKSIDDIIHILHQVRGNPMAKAGLEMAVWDLLAKSENISLANKLGGTQQLVPVGVSIGLQNSIDDLLSKVEEYLSSGYTRIKIKIKPGADLELIKAIRKEFPKTLLQADANCAYTINDLQVFREMDNYNLLLIEQPFADDDFVNHARLQKEITTPVCLDESIESYSDAQTALALGSCKVINIKPGRVGGFAEAIKIHDLCAEKNIPVWHGGMLETGIGRACNVALASLPNFQLPGDISASSRYFREDLIDPPFIVNQNGTITVPTSPGIGVDVVIDKLTSVTERRIEIKS